MTILDRFNSIFVNFINFSSRNFGIKQWQVYCQCLEKKSVAFLWEQLFFLSCFLVKIQKAIFHFDLSQSSRSSYYILFLILLLYIVDKCSSTVKTFYFGRSKYLGSGWLYQKTKGTLWTPTSRDLSDSTVGSPLNSARKKLQRPKLKKSQTAPWKWHFSPHDFLGLQQSLCNINFSFGIFMREYQRKNLLKSTTVIAESVKQVDFDDLFLTAIFA